VLALELFHETKRAIYFFNLKKHMFIYKCFSASAPLVLVRMLPGSSNLNYSHSSTTIHAGLNPDRKLEIITVVFPKLRNGIIDYYTLTVYSDTAGDIFETIGDAMVQLKDIGPVDGFQEILVPSFNCGDGRKQKSIRDLFSGYENYINLLGILMILNVNGI
jgi:hypothetical protein